jgi:predicted transcriptional regulator
MSMNEKEFILMVQYAMERDTITEIARKLGYSRNTIYKKFDQFEIPFTPSERNVESMATLSPLLADIQFDMKTLNELELAMEDWMSTGHEVIIKIKLAKDSIINRKIPSPV